MKGRDTMKKYLVAAVACGLLLLGGCQTKNEDKKTADSSEKAKVEQASTKKQLGKTTVVDGIELTVSNVQTKPVASEKEKKTLYTVDIKGKNISSFAKGLGAIDFQLVTKDGKKHKISTNYNAFGTELETEKEVEGTAYFELAEKDKVSKIDYIPSDKSLMSWDIK